MKPKTKLYIIVPFGYDGLYALFTQGLLEIVSVHPCPDGIHTLAIVVPSVWEFKQHFLAIPGVTILPHHREQKPLGPNMVTMLSYCGVVTGDTMQQAARKLFTFHGHASIDPDLD